jgi:hypothetical protein
MIKRDEKKEKEEKEKLDKTIMSAREMAKTMM